MEKILGVLRRLVSIPYIIISMALYIVLFALCALLCMFIAIFEWIFTGDTGFAGSVIGWVCSDLYDILIRVFKKLSK